MLRRLAELPQNFETLATQARGEGYLFLDRLAADLVAGRRPFDGPGEVLLGAFDGDEILAIGGLHKDPYLTGNDGTIGRLRRVYVAPARRRSGIARALVLGLCDDARGVFDCIRLRVPDARAAQFYEAIGFVPVAAADATHTMSLPSSCDRGR